MNFKGIISVLLKAIVIFIFGYILVFFYKSIRHGHIAKWNKYKDYQWIFKDSVSNQIVCRVSSSFQSFDDVLTNYRFKDNNIFVWDLKQIKNFDLNKLAFINNQDLAKIKFQMSQGLNKKSDLELILKFGIDFKDSMIVALDENSEITKEIKGANYKGFYGSMNKAALYAEGNDSQVIFKFMDGSTPSLFLFYKKNQNLYLIVIRSEKKLDNDIIQILNLK